MKRLEHRVSRRLNMHAYVHFEAVARRGTLTRAAEELSVSPSAVSQQIKQLEQHLGLRLFRREGRAMSLTLEGEQLFQASSTAIRILREAQDNLGGRAERQRLSLRTSPGFGVRWLGPRLSDFTTRHPSWDLRIDAAPDPTDFEREIMDVDIRYGHGSWAGLHVEPVLSETVLPLCSPGLRDALRDADPRTRLDQSQLIVSSRALVQWEGWLHYHGVQLSGPRKSLLFDRSSIALQMALDGAGVVLESLTLAAEEVARHRLVPLMPELPVMVFPAYWLVCPARHLNRRAVRDFRNWLTEQAIVHDKRVAEILAEFDLQSTDLPVDLLGPDRVSE